MISTMTPSGSAPLTAADRCDRCGARAAIRVVLASGNLDFCSHHARAYDGALRTVAVEVLHAEPGTTD